MDTKKYIIEIPDNTAWLQWVKVSVKDGHAYFDFKDPEDLTPYTEPDLDAVRKEAYQQGYKDGYNKHDEEIKVGNEVDGKGGRGIITKISNDGDHFNVMWENGSTGYYMIEDFKKTGRHFPEIAEVLMKINGEKNGD